MNYRQSINLMQLRDAKLLQVEINGRKVNAVVIPVQENHISVTVDPQTRQPNAAYLNLIADEPGNAYYDKILRENPKATLPSHMIYNNPMPDARKRLDALMEQQLRNDANYMATNPTNEEIAKRAHYDVRRALYVGRAYSLGQPNEFRGSAPQAEVSAYQPTGEESGTQQQAQQGYATQQPAQQGWQLPDPPKQNPSLGDDGLPF